MALTIEPLNMRLLRRDSVVTWMRRLMWEWKELAGGPGG